MLRALLLGLALLPLVLAKERDLFVMGISASPVYGLTEAWHDLTVRAARLGRDPGMESVNLNLTSLLTSAPTILLGSALDPAFLSRSWVANTDAMYTPAMRKPVRVTVNDTGDVLGATDQSMALLSLTGWKETLQICPHRLQIWPRGYKRTMDRCPKSRLVRDSATFVCSGGTPFWPQCTTSGVIGLGELAQVGFELRSRNIRIAADLAASVTDTVTCLRVGSLCITLDRTDTFPMSDSQGHLHWTTSTVVIDSSLPNETVVVGLRVKQALSLIYSQEGKVTIEAAFAEDDAATIYPTAVLSGAVLVYFLVVLFRHTRMLAMLTMVAFGVVEVFYLWTDTMAMTLHRATTSYSFEECVAISVLGVAVTAYSCALQALHLRTSPWADMSLVHCSAFPFFAMATLVFEMYPAAYLVCFLCSLLMMAFIIDKAMQSLLHSKSSVMLLVFWGSVLLFVLFYLLEPVCERVTTFHGNEIFAAVVLLLVVCVCVILRSLS